MSAPRLRVAIISAGRMASSIDDEIRASDVWPSLTRQLPYSHAPCYKAFDEVQIVAVSDLIEEKCQTFCRRWDVPRYYLDYREMIEVEKPDIVSIATPASSHAEMALFALAHGVRGLYCEKAMCCSLAEADAIVSGVAQHGATFMLGAQRRHHPHFAHARQIVESGEIGELIGVTSWFESALLHALSHTVDGSLYLAGDATAEWVFGVLGPARSLDEIEQRRIAPFPEYDHRTRRWSGDPGCLTYTARLTNGVFLHHLPAITDLRWEIVCANGYVRILDNNDSLELFRRRATSYSFDRVPLETIAPASSHVALVKDLLRCMREHETPLANEMVARNGMEILMGCAASHLQDGRKVKLPLSERGMVIPSH
ncbi:MAG: Gfo/Idh/MocA family oxidoreductase [Candidatus Latescibacterota bacterium]